MTVATGIASRARAAVAAELELAGITAVTDSGAGHPAPAWVLVGLPSLTARGLASSSFSVPVYVISGDPLNDEHAVDRLYALADDTALALSADQYRPTSWQGGLNAEPLPAIELAATVTLTYETEA